MNNRFINKILKEEWTGEQALYLASALIIKYANSNDVVEEESTVNVGGIKVNLKFELEVDNGTDS